MLVAKLDAVLNETYWSTAGRSTGFSGRLPWILKRAYSTTIPIAVNHRQEVAYRRQDCSRSGFTPMSR